MCKDFCWPRKRAGQPFERAVRVIGDAWSLRIVGRLALGPQRFTGLEQELGVASNILTDRLSRLASEGILARGSIPGRIGTSAYRLTRKGRDLVPMLMELERWGRRHDPSEIYRRLARRVPADRLAS